MPIEVFPGKTGERLIARLPVKGDSYARLLFRERSPIEVAYSGCWANGYPTLCPRSLEQISLEIAQYVEKQHQDYIAVMDTELSQQASCGKRADEITVRQWEQDIEPKPLFPRIMVGEKLMLVLGSHYPEVNRTSLGTVAGWEIFNY